jgi:hypothetical protein
MENVSIVVKSNEKILKRVKYFILIPSEMETLKIILKEPLTGDIFLEVIKDE